MKSGAPPVEFGIVDIEDVADAHFKMRVEDILYLELDLWQIFLGKNLEINILCLRKKCLNGSFG